MEVSSRSRQIRRSDGTTGDVTETTRTRDTAFIDADAISLSEKFVESYAAFPRDDQRQPNP